MKRSIFILFLLSLIGITTPITLYSGHIALEIAKNEWSTKSRNIPPLPLSLHFGNIALLAFTISLIIGSSSAFLIFKTLRIK
jgi:hypothetical protein